MVIEDDNGCTHDTLNFVISEPDEAIIDSVNITDVLCWGDANGIIEVYSANSGFYSIGGGFGGLISFALKDPSRAPGVYDALEWTKGPSLGTEFSLACAYTLLAHYQELDWAESCGVPRNLIRLSAGAEDTGRLVAALAAALDHA